jgi:hypothetical protein
MENMTYSVVLDHVDCCNARTAVRELPHMETIALLVVLVACTAAVTGWVATRSQRISYAGLQIAFAFFYSVFQGYAPDRSR